MDGMRISAAAREEIVRLRGSGTIVDPVVSLVEVARPSKECDDLKGKGLSENVFVHLTEKQISQLEKLEYWLEVAFHEREECRPEDVAELDGELFAMNLFLRNALSHSELDFEAGRFLLRSGSKRYRNLRSLIEVQDKRHGDG